MDIGEALSFVFEDQEWVSKILVGALITLIPIFGWFALMGYAIAVVRNVMAGQARPLPTWDDWGRYFKDGLMFWIATLIYALPFLLILCPVGVVWVSPMLAGENEVEVLTEVAGGVSVLLGCLALLYGILLALLTPVLQIRYAETGELGACLRFGEVFRFMLDNIGSLILSQVVLWIAGLIIGVVASLIGTILGLIPICGWLLMLVLSMVISIWLIIFSAHMYGQIGRQAGVTPGQFF